MAGRIHSPTWVRDFGNPVSGIRTERFAPAVQRSLFYVELPPRVLFESGNPLGEGQWTRRKNNGEGNAERASAGSFSTQASSSESYSEPSAGTGKHSQYLRSMGKKPGRILLLGVETTGGSRVGPGFPALKIGLPEYAQRLKRQRGPPAVQ